MTTELAFDFQLVNRPPMRDADACLKESSSQTGLAFPSSSVDVNATHRTTQEFQEGALYGGFDSVVTLQARSQRCR